MSGKTEKKLRKLANKKTNREFTELVESVKEQMKNLHKPAPAWFPKRLWRWLGRQFLNI